MAVIATFGEWLQRRRLALGLTQTALAQHAGCTPVALRKIEAGERRPSAQLAVRLARYLALPLDQHQLFMAAARGLRSHEHLPLPELPHEPTVRPLPHPTTPLIGREVAIAALERLIGGGARLLTLAGAPGVGKTRLALALAHLLTDRFPDGVFFVALAAASTAGDAADAVVRALGVTQVKERAPDALVAGFLQRRTALLVLDNFEQVVDTAPMLSNWLAAAPKARIVVTSRTPLRLMGEHVYRVEPLTLPDAAALFLARAQAGRSFTPSAGDLRAIDAIVQRLDGLPLAIELAAARLRLFSPPALLAQLDRAGVAALGAGARDMPPRQQTLTACLGWSYALLTETPQRCFAILGVFAGGFTIDAAVAVAGSTLRGDSQSTPFVEVSDLQASSSAQSSILLALEELVDHSLVTLAGDGRCGMLEVVRQYALQQLGDAELQAARRRHAAYYAAWVEDAADALHSADGVMWKRMIDREYSNLAAALAWCSDTANNAVSDGMRIVVALHDYWYMSAAGEGWRWTNLLVPYAERAAPAIGGRLLVRAGHFADRFGELRRAQDLYAQAAAIGEQIDDQALLAEVGRNRAVLAPDRALAHRWIEESLMHARASEVAREIGWSLIDLAVLHKNEGRYDTATALYDEALLCFREGGSIYDSAFGSYLVAQFHEERGDLARAEALFARLDEPAIDIAFIVVEVPWRLGCIALARGDIERAEEQFRESIRRVQRYDLPYVLRLNLAGLAAVACRCGDYQCAVQLLGADQRHFVDIHVGHWLAPYWPMYDDALAASRAALGEEAFAAAWEAGRGMGVEELLRNPMT